MKVILVDDDATMHVILSKMLQKLPEVHIVGAFTDTKSAAFFYKRIQILASHSWISP